MPPAHVCAGLCVTVLSTRRGDVSNTYTCLGIKLPVGLMRTYCTLVELVIRLVLMKHTANISKAYLYIVGEYWILDKQYVYCSATQRSEGVSLVSYCYLTCYNGI